MATDPVDLIARILYGNDTLWGTADSLGQRRCVELAHAVLAALETAGGVHGSHGYRSSACIHAVDPGREHLHLDCQTNATRYDGTAKVAAQCKYGAEPCNCDCHQEASDGA